MDAATGLIYVGNGQYYDPVTGRFLTRDARPGQNNPYTPIDPTGTLLGPLALLALAYGRRKSRGKWDMLVILLVLGLAAGLSLSACGIGEGAGMASETRDNITATVLWQAPKSDGSVRVALTVTATFPGENGAPTETVTFHCRGMLTPIDTVPLDPFVRSYKNVKISAADMKVLYDHYQEQITKPNLTIGEFLGLMLYREMSSGELYQYHPDARDKMIRALAVQLWSGYSGFQFCQGQSTCFNGVFNWLIRYSESAWIQYIEVVIKKNPVNWGDIVGGGDGRARTAARHIGDLALNHPNIRGYTEQVPYHWGNPPAKGVWWLPVLGKKPPRGEQNDQIHYFEPVSGFVIHSIGQGRYWCNLAKSKGIRPPAGTSDSCMY